MFAASRWFSTPKTPHSSLNLSSMARRYVKQSVAQRKSGATAGPEARSRSRVTKGRREGLPLRARKLDLRQCPDDDVWIVSQRPAQRFCRRLVDEQRN